MRTIRLTIILAVLSPVASLAVDTCKEMRRDAPTCCNKWDWSSAENALNSPPPWLAEKATDYSQCSGNLLKPASRQFVPSQKAPRYCQTANVGNNAKILEFWSVITVGDVLSKKSAKPGICNRRCIKRGPKSNYNQLKRACEQRIKGSKGSSGLHSLAWLHNGPFVSGSHWKGNIVGFFNFSANVNNPRSPSKNHKFKSLDDLNRKKTTRTANCQRAGGGGCKLKSGERYIAYYKYDMSVRASTKISMRIFTIMGEEILESDQRLGVINSKFRANSKKFGNRISLILGHDCREAGPEVPSIGWRYDNLCLRSGQKSAQSFNDTLAATITSYAESVPCSEWLPEYGNADPRYPTDDQPATRGDNALRFWTTVHYISDRCGQSPSWTPELVEDLYLPTASDLPNS